MVSRIADSFALAIKMDIYNAIYNSYSNLTATYASTGSWSSTAFDTMVAHVEAATNAKAACFGTKTALARVLADSGYVSENMKDQLWKQGFLGNYHGTDLIEVGQVHTAGTDTFAINGNFLMILPASEKLVKLVFEGDALIVDNSSKITTDRTMEYEFMKGYGVAVLSAGKYGIMRLS